jgi:putative flippase GtrA
MADVRNDPGGSPAAAGFGTFCAAVVRRLPFGLAALVAPSLVGFALINGVTFGVDLGLLTMLHGWWGLPLWLSITLGYLGAFGLGFVLNRALNFRSHAPVGAQAVRYGVVIGVNYLVFLLGVGGGLTALGVEYHLSRLAAGVAEGVFMYCALRWVVFPSRAESLDEREVQGAGQPDLADRRLAGVEGAHSAVGLPAGPAEERE